LGGLLFVQPTSCEGEAIASISNNRWDTSEKEQESFALSMSGPWKIGLYTASQATPRIEIRFVSFGVYEPETAE